MARYKSRTRPFRVPIYSHITDREDSGVQLDEPSSPVSKHFESSSNAGDVKSVYRETSNRGNVGKSASHSDIGRKPQYIYQHDHTSATNLSTSSVLSRYKDKCSYKSRTKDGAEGSPLLAETSSHIRERRHDLKSKDVGVTFTLDEDEGLGIRDSNSSINRGSCSHTQYLRFDSESSDGNSDTEISENFDSIELSEVSVELSDSLKDGVQQSDSVGNIHKHKSSKDPKKKRFHRLVRKPAIKRSQSLGCEKDLVPEHALFLQFDPAEIHSKEPVEKDENETGRRTIYKTSSADAAMMAGEVLPLDTTEPPKSKPISSIAKNVKRKLQKLHRRNTDSFLGAAIMSVRGPKVTQTEALEWGKTFESLLMDKNGLEMFKNFLKSEFSDENIEFWIACEDFKSTRTNKLTSRAQKIYSDFVAVNAPRQINLDSKTRLETITNLDNPTRDLYRQAQKRIQFLMENDSYKRFLETDAYKNLIGSSAASCS